MAQTLTSTFVEGAFVPDELPALPSGTRVRLIIETLDEAFLASKEALEELDRLCDELPINSGGVRLTRDELHERH